MRSLLLSIVFVTGLGTGPALPQDAASDIRSVIAGQIEAFRADDFETAFSFASPSIKQLFGSFERFGQMVQSGYPMVWRPGDVRFSELTDRGGRKVQSVFVTDQDGVPYILDYEMISSEEGWQINGVTVRRTGATGA